MLSVIKTGGKVINEGLSDLVLDIKTNFTKERLTLIHGGGIEVTEIATRMGKQQKFVVSPKSWFRQDTTFLNSPRMTSSLIC